MSIGRGLLGVLVFGEAGTFQEIEHRHRVGPITLAGPARAGQILAALFRVLGQVFLAESLHEGKLQRPPAQADHRHPDQLLLEEELEKRHAPVELVLQHENVRPALVVAGHQVGVMHVDLIQALHVPADRANQIHPEAVHRDPGLGDPVHAEAQAALYRWNGKRQLEQRQGEQRPAPEQGIERQQQGGKAAAQWGGEEAQHEILIDTADSRRQE